MPTTLRDTGIPVIGDVPWGGHFSIFYETKRDLLDTVVSFFRAGLANNEACAWAIPDALTQDEAEQALRHGAPDLDRDMAARGVEIFPARAWYIKGGGIDARRVIAGWRRKLRAALDKGYQGLRICGDLSWMDKAQWPGVKAYEGKLHAAIGADRMIVLCAYSLDRCLAADILDTARLHSYTVARRRGEWEIVQTPELKRAKREIKRLNQVLERRVIERTRQLADTNEELRSHIAERKRAEAQLQAAQAEIGRVARLTTMGALAASVAHEINQPLAATVTNTQTALRWLAKKPPNLGEARRTAQCALVDANRAGEVVKRVRALLTKARPRFESVDLNDVITKVLALTSSDQEGHRIRVQTKLSPRLSRVRGDRIQLQQVMVNLISNAIAAMRANQKQPRNLLVSTRMNRAGAIQIAIADSGPGLDPGAASRLFDPFFTTKPDGMGLGLSVCLSIIEAHGGRLWASPNSPRGAIFQFTLPAAGKRGT